MSAVGFVGAGLMGHGMAANLIKAGHDVTIIAHRNRKPIDNLVARGATEAPDLAAMARACGTVILCVTDAKAVRTVIDQLKPHLDEHHLIIDTSTSDPVLTEKLSGELSEVGVAFADAPLTGGAQQAAEGVLGALVGCDKQIFERVKSVMEAFCNRVVHFGPAGSGHRAKLVNNYLVFAMVAAIADTYNVARSAGIDWQDLFEVMKSGSNNSEALRRMVEPTAGGDFDGYKFTLANAVKDMSYYLSFADDAGLTSDLARVTGSVYEKAVDAGYGDLFISRLIDPDTAGKDPEC